MAAGLESETSVVTRRGVVPSEREASHGVVADTTALPVVSVEAPRPAGLRERVEGRFVSIARDLNVKRVLEGQPARPALVIGIQGFLKSFPSRLQSVSYAFVILYLGLDSRAISEISVAQTFITVTLGLVVAYIADRVSRLKMVGFSTVVFGAVALLFGIWPTVFVFVLSTLGQTALGTAGTAPTNSLLTDYYPPEARGRLFGFTAAIGTLGATLWAIPAGFVVDAIGFQSSYVLGSLVFAGTAVLCLLLREPERGRWDRIRLGASEEVAGRKRQAPTVAESLRVVRSVNTLRRVCLARAFLAASGQVMVPIVLLALIHASNAGPIVVGVIIAVQSVATLVGVEMGGLLADRVLLTNPGRIMQLLGLIWFVNLAVLVVYATTANLAILLPLFVIQSVVSTAPQVAETALVSQVTPARVRTLGLQMPDVYGLCGALLILPFLGAFGSSLSTVFIVGAVIGSGGAIVFLTATVDVAKDMESARLAVLTEQQAADAEATGQSKLLVARGVEVEYDGVQVLFGVDIDIDDGELVALLGTNGAGKSTLLHAFAGLAEPSGGAIFLAGRDTTHAPPHELAHLGVVSMPGGKGVFATMTVTDNLRTAGWLLPADEAKRRIDDAMDFFPRLSERRDTLAGNLSGGEQQMLALAQAMVMTPRLLLVDELSLGLAPAVVEQLLQALVKVHEAGTTVVLVEQSVDLALSVARRAVFMEKGEIRFDGPAEELRARPELLRSVYIKGTRGRSATRTAARPRRSIADAGTVVLDASGLSVSYGGVLALNNADVSVAAGEIVGLIGPNGAGKTTLFDAICGFLPATGTVTVAGRDVSAATPAQRSALGLARSFQDARLFPALSVLENVLLALHRRGGLETSAALSALWLPQSRKAEAKLRAQAEAVLESVGLIGDRDKVPAELSTGMRRVLDLGCMMAAQPDILLLDEPSSGIAQAEAEELAPLLDRIRRELGCGLLIIEHDMSLLTAVADRLVGMVLGETIVTGSVDEVTGDERVVAAYLGTTERVLHRSGRARLASAVGTANPSAFQEAMQ
jgi:ABC-type branched-subunit amino acid transport system ATPase component/sugar phosphate permease